jgi:predicted AlkP superfamily pyrophosphatase or phosphodiesterase
MPGDAGRVVVLDVVGLQPGHVTPERTPTLDALLPADARAALRPAFPALTVPAQTTMATGRLPSVHGDVASGEYDRRRDEVAFWERDRGDRDRVWEAASDDAGLTTGALFFQHLIGSTADVAVTPSPVEDEDNNLVEMDCWSNPDEFYDLLADAYGHFPLHNYWGPGANDESTRWILRAAARTVERYDPDMLWVYVPHLDYAGLREGPDSEAFRAALGDVDQMLDSFVSHLRDDDRWDETAVVVASEYGFHGVERFALPNVALRDAGLLVTGDDGDVDLAASAAFAMVDHQVAHVYADDPGAARDALTGRSAPRSSEPRSSTGSDRALADLDGVAEVVDDADRARLGMDHPNAGDLVLVADRDAWFQYYWWTDPGDAPPYAVEMDIHAKPGFDPCELFIGDDGMVAQDPSLVGGSHGRVDDDALPLFGVGGPAAPALRSDEVEATAVAPTVVDLLGVRHELDVTFDSPSTVE